MTLHEDILVQNIRHLCGIIKYIWNINDIGYTPPIVVCWMQLMGKGKYCQTPAKT